MKGGFEMKKRLSYIFHFLILFFALFLQSSPLIKKISVGGVWPNMVFMLLFVYALYLKNSEVFLLAVISGSVTDLIFGDIYGVYTLLFVGFVLLFQLLNRVIYSESLPAVFIYALLAEGLFEGIFLIIDLSIPGTDVISGEIIKRYIVKCIYSAVFALPVYSAAAAIHRRKQEVRRR